MKYSLFFVLFFNFICSDKIFSSQDEKEFLFENYWKNKQVNFASLSETQNPEISQEEDILKYSAFINRCMQEYYHSIIIWTERRKTVYVCSENKEKIEGYIKSEQEFFKQNLRNIAEIIKQGKPVFIKGFGPSNKERCFIAARKSSELEKIDSLHLGGIVMNLAQDKVDGIFSIDGCDIKVSQVYHDDSVDLEQMYPPKK